jgi:hypothetical protein
MSESELVLFFKFYVRHVNAELPTQSITLGQSSSESSQLPRERLLLG